MTLRILYEDEYLVAIDKPEGFYVHPPERGYGGRIAYQFNAMALLRDQLGQLIYPVHRIDRATSGVVLYSKSSASAAALQSVLQQGLATKQYIAVTRGWVKDTAATGKNDAPLLSNTFYIDRPLKNEHGTTQDAKTWIEPLAYTEQSWASRDFPTSRYSLLIAQPISGRIHQIRRHLERTGYPIIGDTVYGDTFHNKYFKVSLQLSGLCLKAATLSFPHPHFKTTVTIRSRFNHKWLKLFDLFGACPLLQDSTGKPS